MHGLCISSVINPLFFSNPYALVTIISNGIKGKKNGSARNLPTPVASLPVSCRGVLTAVGDLATFSPITPYVEYAPAQIYKSPLRSEIQRLSTPVVNGKIDIPNKPGIGIEIPKDLMNSFNLNL